MGNRFSGRAASFWIALPLPLLLAGCGEDVQLSVTPQANGEIAFRLQDSEGKSRGCLVNLLVVQENSSNVVWSAGRDDPSRCENMITTRTLPAGYSSETQGRIEPGRTYEVQAYGPGFHTTTSFTMPHTN